MTKFIKASHGDLVSIAHIELVARTTDGGYLVWLDGNRCSRISRDAYSVLAGLVIEPSCDQSDDALAG
jgi:hypothetical protein